MTVSTCPSCGGKLTAFRAAVPVRGLRPELPNVCVNCGWVEIAHCNNCNKLYVEVYGKTIHEVKALEI